jgi:hypothetical protein
MNMKKTFGIAFLAIVLLCGLVSCGWDTEETKSNINDTDNYDPDTDDGEKNFDSWQFNMAGTFTVSYTNKSSRNATYPYSYTDLITVSGYSSENGARAAARVAFESAGSNWALMSIQTRSDYKSGGTVTEIKITNFTSVGNGS